MIPGGGAIGQFPNVALGLPILDRAKSATPSIRPTKEANPHVEPTMQPKLANYPRDE